MKIDVNPDAKIREEIRAKIKENDGYCPCKLEKIPDNRCICKEFREMIKNNKRGACHCGLFILS